MLVANDRAGRSDHIAVGQRYRRDRRFAEIDIAYRRYIVGGQSAEGGGRGRERGGIGRFASGRHAVEGKILFALGSRWAGARGAGTGGARGGIGGAHGAGTGGETGGSCGAGTGGTRGGGTGGSCGDAVHGVTRPGRRL